ncbi:FAD-dependent monooxygenase [Nonomuraea basaltis]|uniref:FAD-dependent monooxygenase n=1 Tax=Nonomuraea basaltis TaxID=2495887 RepID=UPI00110C6F41|nr:FAD-dependent monooxygenase [Nonomuraea basaltis]TMR92321.1 FAD-dependent oxidoreductase [Nonomuraea basaltis]
MTALGVGRVLVIGAGVGGLTLAHELVRAGIDVHVYEADDGSGERFQGYRLTLASGGNGASTAMQDAVRLGARLAEVGRDERDLTSALAEYQDDLLERGNAAVEVGKRAQKRFVPAADEVTR